MGLETTASLIIATFELSIVRLIRGAIRTADISSGRGQPASGLGPAPNPEPLNRRHFQPEPVFEPRRHIHTPPVYERPAVIHSKPCQAERRVEHINAPPVVIPIEVEVPRLTCAEEGPIPPVWKQLPPVPPRPVDFDGRRRFTPPRVIRAQRGIVVDLHA